MSSTLRELAGIHVPEGREHCWEAVPGYMGLGHMCHRKIHHPGPHRANLCGRGHRGGRAATWTSAEDLKVTGAGTGEECAWCHDARVLLGHSTCRIVTLNTEATP